MAILEASADMSKKYKNTRAAVIIEDSKVSFLFSDTLKEAEFQLVLADPLQRELLAWLVSRHTTLYQGREGEIDRQTIAITLQVRIST